MPEEGLGQDRVDGGIPLPTERLPLGRPFMCVPVLALFQTVLPLDALEL